MPLLHENTSKRERDYRNLYTKETKRLIEERYKDDIESTRDILNSFGLLAAISEQLSMMYVALAVIVSSSLLVNVLALHVDRHEQLCSLLWWIPMQLAFRILLGITAYRCIARMLSGRAMKTTGSGLHS